MKIYITWPAWSWKSTLAQKLGSHYAIPVIHLDTLLYWDTWIENENYHILQEEAIRQPEWIIEGSSCSIIKKMPDIDQIIILDTPAMSNVFRILQRYYQKKRVGIHLPNRFSSLLLFKTLIWRKRQFPRIVKNIQWMDYCKKLTIFHSPYWVFESLIKSREHPH
jgi:adenylate kinase family enzyme